MRDCMRERGREGARPKTGRKRGEEGRREREVGRIKLTKYAGML